MLTQHRLYYHLGKAQRHIWEENLPCYSIDSVLDILRSVRSGTHCVTTVRSETCSQDVPDRYRIIFRAFQGIGAAGIYSLTPVILSEMVPREQFGKYNAIGGTSIGVSFLLGPLVGGAINANNGSTSWRWIFLIK